IGVPSSVIRHPDNRPLELRKSLGADAISFLARFNAAVVTQLGTDKKSIAFFRAKPTRELIVERLGSFASRVPFRLPGPVRDELMSRYSEANQRIFERFGMNGFHASTDPGTHELSQISTLDGTVSFTAALWIGLQKYLQNEETQRSTLE